MWLHILQGFAETILRESISFQCTNMGRGLIRGAGAFRHNIPSPPVRFTANGCFRCLEATPKRYDAARTHQVRDCPFPPNQGSARQPQFRQQQSRPAQPSYRIVMFPDHQTGQQQVATVSMGNTSTQDQGPSTMMEGSSTALSTTRRATLKSFLTTRWPCTGIPWTARPKSTWQSSASQQTSALRKA